MFGIDHAVSFWTFIRSLGIGFIIGILYDLFRAFRLCVSRGRISVALQDVLFFILTSMITFLFLLKTSYGVVRWYIIAGEIIGFSVYRLSCGKVFFSTASRMSAAFIKLFTRLKDSIKKLLQRIVKRFSRADGKYIAHAKKKERKSKKNMKKYLQLAKRKVYNKNT